MVFDDATVENGHKLSALVDSKNIYNVVIKWFLRKNCSILKNILFLIFTPWN